MKKCERCGKDIGEFIFRLEDKVYCSGQCWTINFFENPTWVEYSHEDVKEVSRLLEGMVEGFVEKAYPVVEMTQHKWAFAGDVRDARVPTKQEFEHRVLQMIKPEALFWRFDPSQKLKLPDGIPFVEINTAGIMIVGTKHPSCTGAKTTFTVEITFQVGLFDSKTKEMNDAAKEK